MNLNLNEDELKETSPRRQNDIVYRNVKSGVKENKV